MLLTGTSFRRRTAGRPRYCRLMSRRRLLGSSSRRRCGSPRHNGGYREIGAGNRRRPGEARLIERIADGPVVVRHVVVAIVVAVIIVHGNVVVVVATRTGADERLADRRRWRRRMVLGAGE